MTVEIRKTQFRSRIIHEGAGLTSHQECWEAETTDGLWRFEREDTLGTPWMVFHNPSVADDSWPIPVMICHSLTHCQNVVANGVALRTLEAQKVEEAQAP